MVHHDVLFVRGDGEALQQTQTAKRKRGCYSFFG
jgi:hypothetical protein